MLLLIVIKMTDEDKIKEIFIKIFPEIVDDFDLNRE